MNMALFSGLLIEGKAVRACGYQGLPPGGDAD